MAEQNRRTFLEWLTYGLGAVFTAVLGVPAIAYLIDPRNRTATSTGFKTVARIEDLQVNVPREVVIRETRRDAWNLYPDEVIGRVFLIRQPDNKVKAYTTICPHLGGSINYTGNSAVPFICPLHGACYKLDGDRINPNNNPAPRGMDELIVRDDPAKPGFIQVKYESFRAMQPEKIAVS